uniref:Uncharacterized protein n=2 Tax=Lutzomyia longipalpis TaxID=7200 RepID=A0A1B0CHH2_LUTLO
MQFFLSDTYLYKLPSKLPSADIFELQRRISVGDFKFLMTAKKLIELIRKENYILYDKYQHREELNNTDRCKIARLDREAFFYLTNCIIEVFPEEEAYVYFFPGVAGKQKGGKLYNAYHNYRRKLFNEGVLKRKSRL